MKTDHKQYMREYYSKNPDKYKRYQKSPKGKLTHKKAQLKYEKTTKGKLARQKTSLNYNLKHPGFPNQKKFRKNNPKRCHEICIKSRIKHHNKFICRKTSQSVFTSCKLLNENCAICNLDQNIERHHPNYDLPFHVYFLCRKCHHIIHVKEKNLK